MNLTPLRLIAIEKTPSPEDDQSASPVTMITEHEAITRKVPEAATTATPENLSIKPKRFPFAKLLLPAGAVAVVAMVVIAALAMKAKRPSQPSTPPPAPVAESPPPIKAVPEIIRLEVTAEPMETELSLDGNVLAGHWLNLEVPKDRGIHVLSASAPGYIPFNQQVSFSSDVVLNISLRQAHAHPVRQVAKSRPFQHESKSKSNPKSKVNPSAAPRGPGLEPGMNLDGPSMRPNAKSIDERNPYKP